MVESLIDARDAESTTRHMGMSRPGGTSPASLTARKLLEEKSCQQKIFSPPSRGADSFKRGRCTLA